MVLRNTTSSGSQTKKMSISDGYIYTKYSETADLLDKKKKEIILMLA